MAAEAMKNGIDACPDVETLAAYLDRTLPEGERGPLVAHVAACDTCYFVLTESAQTHATAVIKAGMSGGGSKVDGASRRLLFGRWPMRRAVWPSAAAALATAAVLALLVHVNVISWGGSGSAEWQSLVAAVGTGRPIEPRMTGGFVYGPYRGSLRGASDPASEVSPDVRIAAAVIEKRFDGRTDAASLRTLGVAYLVTGDLSRAVSALEDSASQTADPATLSDLAAAYTARGLRESQKEDLRRALTAAERAASTDAGLPEAAFNRAFALERLGLIAEARRAWAEYLTVDGSSEWAGEARERLKRLERAMP